MSYTPTTWVDGETPVNAENLNKIERGIRQIDQDKLAADQLPTAINTALAQAKASGDFKGDKGDTGATGAAGKTPVKGTDYFTAADKADMVAQVKASLTTENWTFTLESGSTVTKAVYVG